MKKIIALYIFLTVLVWAGIATMIYVGFVAVKDAGGLKPLVAKAWCGKADCL